MNQISSNDKAMRKALEYLEEEFPERKTGTAAVTEFNPQQQNANMFLVMINTWEEEWEEDDSLITYIEIYLPFPNWTTAQCSKLSGGKLSHD